MARTVEAVIDEQGKVRLLGIVRLTRPCRVLVTILEEEPAASVSETALLSEQALAKDWDRPEEDSAWSHLRQVPVMPIREARGFLKGIDTEVER